MYVQRISLGNFFFKHENLKAGKMIASLREDKGGNWKKDCFRENLMLLCSKQEGKEEMHVMIRSIFVTRTSFFGMRMEREKREVRERESERLRSESPEPTQTWENDVPLYQTIERELLYASFEK